MNKDKATKTVLNELEKELGLVEPTALETILVIIALLLILVIAIAILTGIWGYNPTSIEYFNWKIAGTAVVALVIDIIVIRNVD